MKVQDLEVERLSRSSGWAQSNHTSPEKQGDFPDCGRRKRCGDRSQKAAMFLVLKMKEGVIAMEYQ